jgi:hypothetical protein
MTSIDELAAIVRAGCDKRERLARELAAWADGSGRMPGSDAFEFHKLIGDPAVGPFGGQSSIRNWGTGQDIAKLADPHRVLAEVASKRALLAEALGWEHGLVRWDHNVVRACESVIGKPCDCGRDERVRAVLTLLAAPYQETP